MSPSASRKLRSTPTTLFHGERKNRCLGAPTGLSRPAYAPPIWLMVPCTPFLPHCIQVFGPALLSLFPKFVPLLFHLSTGQQGALRWLHKVAGGWRGCSTAARLRAAGGPRVCITGPGRIGGDGRRGSAQQQCRKSVSAQRCSCTGLALFACKKWLPYRVHTFPPACTPARLVDPHSRRPRVAGTGRTARGGRHRRAQRRRRGARARPRGGHLRSWCEQFAFAKSEKSLAPREQQNFVRTVLKGV